MLEVCITWFKKMSVWMCVWVWVCRCVGVWVCVCVFVCVCVYRFINGSTRSILTESFSFFVFFSYSVMGKKIVFYDSAIYFVLFRIIDFRKSCFWIFLMAGFKFFNRIGSIQKSIRNQYFQQKNFSRYHGSFVIRKNVFIVKKLITHKLNGQFLREKSR